MAATKLKNQQVDFSVPVPTAKTAAYTFALGDENTLIGYNSASGAAFTIPPNASVAFRAGANGGDSLMVYQIGAGAITMTPGAGVTFIGANLVTNGIGTMLVAVQVSTNTWLIVASTISLAGINVWTALNTFNGGLQLAVGTTALAALLMQSGATLTTALAGALEFDAVNTYITNDTTSGRGRVAIEQMFKLDAAGAAITTIANFFGATSNIPLVANAYYEIEIWGFFLKGGTTGTNVISLINSAAPTAMDVIFEMSPLTGITATPAANLSAELYNQTGVTTTITTGSLTISVNHYFYLKILLRNGAGTSLKIQLTSNGSSSTPGIGSRWTSKRISPNNVGAFAA